MRSTEAAPNGHADADETTPLISSIEAEPTAQSDLKAASVVKPQPPAAGDDDDDTPLPKFQVFLLCYARMMEPIAFFCIFPFVNQMIQDSGNLSEEDVGFYTGWIESLFSLTQMVAMVPYGRLADRIGRKPVLVWSLCGCSISMTCFGFSKHIWQMILFRCLAGAFAGTVITVRTMISEVSTPKTRARAFSLFAFASYLGLLLGPILGGFLADPAHQFPSLFGRVPFFEAYPYALPTLCIGCFGASATLLCALFVKETLQRKNNDDSEPERPMSMTELLRSPGVALVLLPYAIVMLIGLAYTAVVPVFWFTSPSLGGLGLSPYQISILLASNGIAQSTWLLLAFPPLQRRFGTGGVLRGCAYAMPLTYVLCPVASLVMRGGHTTLFWVLAPILLGIICGVSMAFTGVQLALNDIAPSPDTLATLNAVALTMTAGIRAVAPACFTTLFAIGVKHQILWGFFIWVIFGALAVGFIVSMFWFPAKAEGRLKTRSERDTNEENEE